MFPLLTGATANAINCQETLRSLSKPLVWLFQAGSQEGRTVLYSHGIKVEERVSYFGFQRRIVVTYPDGKIVDFNRTNRSHVDLEHNDFYPSDFLSPNKLSGKRVLDLGCGDGTFVSYLAARGVDAHGLDIYFKRKQRSNPLFRMADGQRSGYPDGEFDVVFSTWSAFTYLMFEHERGVPGARAEAVKFLAETIRITKDGGVIRLSPAPHKKNPSGGVDFSELSSILDEFFPNVKIKTVPDKTWLRRTHGILNAGRDAADARFPSEIWVELEKTPIPAKVGETITRPPTAAP